MLCPIIDGKFNPSNEDVDAAVKTRGIRATFDGITADHVYKSELLSLNDVYVTETVGFKFYHVCQAVFLVVVSRSDTDAVYVFRADERNRKFVFQPQHDSTVCGYAAWVRKAIAKCPTRPTQEDIAQTVSATVSGSIDGIKAEMKTHGETIRQRVNCHMIGLALVFLMAIAGVGGVLLLLRGFSDASHALRQVDSRVVDMAKTQAVLTNVSLAHGTVLKELQTQTGELHDRQKELAREQDRQAKDIRDHDRRIGVLADEVEALRATQDASQKQRAIGGSQNNGVSVHVPRADTIFDYPWSITTGLGGLVGFLVLSIIVVYAVDACAKAEDAAFQKKKKKP